jgi:hypothetical protein
MNAIESLVSIWANRDNCMSKLNSKNGAPKLEGATYAERKAQIIGYRNELAAIDAERRAIDDRFLLLARQRDKILRYISEVENA